ncbi:MAG: SpoIIE family protein phosphatase [Actinomycetota bacterium]|nr:SpoIIE family protein phosphatase [Actinomycetota bacterium]
MIRRKRLNQSLANRYMLLAALLVLFTTALLGFASASGVYRMALREESARQRAQSEVVQSQVAGHVLTSSRVLTTLSLRPELEAGDELTVRRALAAAFASNAEYLRGIVVIRSDGEILSEYPAGIGPTDVERSLLASEATLVGEFNWLATHGGRGGTLWFAVRLRTAGGEERILLGEVRTAFIDSALRQLALSEEQPTAFLVDESGVILFAAGDPDAYRNGLVSYADGAAATPGAVQITVKETVEFKGVYQQIADVPGIGWRCVVVEPADFVAWETWLALRPAIFAWGVSALFVAIVAVVGVGLLVRPLRLLDAHARAAASGALLEPLAVGRRDEVGRLIESFNSVADRLRRMHDMSQLLARSADRDEVLDGIVSSLAHMLNAQNVGVLLIDDDCMNLRLVRAIGSLSDHQEQVVEVSTSELISRTLENRDVEVFDGSASDDTVIALHGIEGMSGLSAAFVKGTEVLGAVIVVCEDGRTFAAAEIDMMRSFAAQASVALDNARLFAEERRSRREAEVLRRTAELLSGPEDLRAAIEEVAAVEADALGMSTVFVALSVPGALGSKPPNDPVLESRLLESWALHAADSSARPVLHDTLIDAGLLAFAAAFDARYLLVTPLHQGSDIAGLIVLGDHTNPFARGSYGLAIADTIGKQVGLALDVACLFEQARNRADNLETIFRISQAVSSSLQSKVVLNRVLDVVQKILSADAVMLMTYERDKKFMSVPMARGILHPEMLEMVFPPGVDIPGRVYSTKEPERIATLRDLESRLAAAAVSQGLESAIFVPLLARGRSLGVLALFGRSADAFTAEDLDLLRTFGSQAALAIDTANLFSREHHVATVLQESILPTELPLIEGIDASSAYVPAGSELEIGGDYYDLFVAPDGRLVMANGDVCGKGVEAATKTSMIKYLIRGMIAAGATPGPVLAELNRLLVESGDPSDIVTLWLGTLTISDGQLTWANGGHPPAMVLTPCGEILRLETTGALLGAVMSADFGESRLVVAPGSTLMLYTDGVTEARVKGHFFGEGRVRRALRQGGSAAAVTDRLLAAVQRFAAGELRDDAAILVVRRPDVESDSSGSVMCE